MSSSYQGISPQALLLLLNGLCSGVSSKGMTIGYAEVATDSLNGPVQHTVFARSVK